MSQQEANVELSIRAFRKVLFVACAIAAMLAVPLYIIAYALEGGFDRFERNAAYAHPSAKSMERPSAQSGPAVEQTVYVPVYSHIYVRDGQAYRLAATLSIRNTDPGESLTLRAVRYYDSAGKLVRSHLAEPLAIAPLATTEFFVEEKHDSGGAGAKFLVEWTATKPICLPIIETIMVGTEANQGVSFARSGVVIEDSLGGTEESAIQSVPDSPISQTKE